MEQLRDATFPKDFFFGVADADLQVIGEQNCLDNEGSAPTVWTHFAQTGHVFNNEPPLRGIDRFHRWKTDAEIMKGLSVHHYRTSVSLFRMLRVDGSVNEKAVAWYREYFTYLKQEGFSIHATLYHWDLPMYLSEKGGWKNRDIVDYFVRFALVVQEQLGDLIDEYFILNEPFQFTLLSYHLGEHAPGERDLRGGLQAVHNAMLAQGKTLRAMKEKNPSARIGTVYNSRPFYALTTSPEDIYARTIAEEYQTGIFLEPLFLGRYPQSLQAKFNNIWPDIQPGDLETIQVGNALDSFGLNFYRGMTIQADPSAELGFREIQYSQGVKNGLGWPVYVQPTYPEGLYDMLRELHYRYTPFGLKNMCISESGACWDDRISPDGKVHDDFRIYFFREHMKQMQKAILAGVPLKGFFLWSLMDNYEWEISFKPGSNFGIVHVDRETLERIPKDSYYWYKKVIETGKIV